MFMKRSFIGRCALVCAVALCFTGLTACGDGADALSPEDEELQGAEAGQVDWANDRSAWPTDLDTARNVDYLPDIDKDLIFELNKLRYNPVRYCKEVGLPSLDGLSPEQEFLLDKAGRHYTKSYPLSKLYSVKGLWLAAFDNNHNQQIKGGTGHTEWTGRINGRYGTSGGGLGENAGPPNIANQASGGASIAAKIVNEMIRDRGVAGKGHRTNCMNAQWNVVGASAINDVNASHGYVTFDFAGSFTDNASAAECDIPFAAVAYNEGGETKSIKLTFSKAVDLKAGDIVFAGVDAADPEAAAEAGHIEPGEGGGIGYNPNDDGGTHTIWWIVVKTIHSGNVTLSVNRPDLKVRPWPRTFTVSRQLVPGLPDGMIAKYEAEGKEGGYNSSGDVTHWLNDGVWEKRD
jgi:hypothetical protein